jgi:hypothetical protein
MAQRADVKLSTILSTTVLTSSATVGVDKTFGPEGFIAPGVSRWVDRSGGIAVGYPWFTFALRPPTKASTVYRASLKVGVPTLATVTASTASGIIPVAPVAYSHGFIGEWLLPAVGTSAERLLLFNLVRSLMITTITASDAAPSDATGSPVVNGVANFDPPY